MSFIEVKNVSKTFKIYTRKSGLKNAFKNFIKREYKYINAVNSISFNVNKGEMVGYIGPNGAGKSTTIKMLTGILKPDEGTIKINNKNPFKDRKDYVKDIGVVFGQKSQLWWDIPVIDSFDLLKDIYNLTDKEYEKNKNELVKLLKIEDVLSSPVRNLSLGQRMRCEIAASLLHNPKILFLDEPTIGLDAISKVEVRNFIKEINKKRKVTVILTSHDLKDIESLTNRIMVIGHGKLLYDGTLKSIKNKFSNTKKLEIIFDKNNKVPKIKNVNILEKNKDKVLLEVNKEMSISNIISEYSKTVEIKDVNLIEEDIDDIIVKLYKEFNI